MPDEKIEMVHLSEIGEWTPEIAEEMAKIEVWPDPKPTVWSIPRERERTNFHFLEIWRRREMPDNFPTQGIPEWDMTDYSKCEYMGIRRDPDQVARIFGEIIKDREIPNPMLAGLTPPDDLPEETRIEESLHYPEEEERNA